MNIVNNIVADNKTMFMSKVYGWMTVGLGLTAIVALGMVFSGAASILAANMPLFIAAIAVELGLILIYEFNRNRLSFTASLLILAAYSGLNGVTFSALFAIYGLTLAAQAFAITAGMFASLSIFGFLTKRNLSGLSTFLFMCLVGVLIALIVEIFVASTMFSFIVSCVAVLLFAVLTAFDTQKIKDMENTKQNALDGALVLYLDFINLFIHIYRLLALSQGRD